MATCGSEHPHRPSLRCVLPLEHSGDHQSGYGALAESWENRSDGVAYLNVSDIPTGRQAQLAELNRIAANTQRPRRAARPAPPTAPVGHRHPDTSREAAERVSRILNNKQFPGIAWVMSVVGAWGIVEQDVSFVYNRYLQPAKELHNEMGSRLQSLRGHGTSPIPGDPWVEYVRDREPCGSNEKISGIREAPGEKGLARINVNGNPALVQRLTSCPIGWEAARKFELTLVDKHGEKAVEEMKCEIRGFAGLQNP